MIEFWILLVVFLIIAIFSFVPSILGAPWIPMQMDNVRKMLSMAEVKSGEVVYDLGSGDGRIIITAAKEFRARSVGIEVNPLWVLWTMLRIRVLGLRGHVNVIWNNIFREDISEADIVTLYLRQGTNDRLRQKLKKELKPGTRVVSHVFTFQGWIPLNTDHRSQIYLYTLGNYREPT